MTSFSDEDIVRIVRQKNPETVEELIQIVEDDFHIAKQNIVNSILRLERQRRLVFKTNPQISKLTLRAYLTSTKGVWYSLIIALSLTTLGTIFTVPEEAYPFTYIRYLFGALFVLFLPGYSFNKALFPAEELSTLERTGLSIGISITLASLIGLLLDLTPFGIRIVPVTISLLTLTTSFATVGVMWEKEIISKENAITDTREKVHSVP